MPQSPYPEWFYYPSHSPPPEWVSDFISVVQAARSHIETRRVSGLTSDRVLEHLRPGLEELDYAVEHGKTKGAKVFRPVLYGPQGQARVTYEIDAAHDELGIVGARFLVLGTMLAYRHKSGGRETTVHSFRDTRDQLDAIYASGRLGLPFEGVLLFGY